MAQDDDLQCIFDWYELVQARKAAPAVEREVWIAAARQLFAPGERQPCMVCGKFKGIAQAHHVVPLSIQYDRGFVYPDHEFEWLCPNHHVMAHLFILSPGRSARPPAFRSRRRTTMALHSDLTPVEFDRLMDLMRRAGRSSE